MPLNVGGSTSLYWKTGLDNRGLRKDATQAKGILANLVKQISALDIFAVVATWTTIKTKRLIKESTILAARYETLGVVLKTVGNNAGYSYEQMTSFAKGLEKAGISMLKARQTLIQMLQAQMDLTKSAELARIAQDAAVIGNINSSEAFNRMITGIQQGRLIILRTIGLNVQFEKAYTEAAKAIGKTSVELTEVEKVQIRTNVVMEAGTRIAGSYEAAMGTAGKQLLSLERHFENLKILIGQAFTPALTEIIEQITRGVKDLNTGLTDNEDIVEDWGANFRLSLLKIEDEVMRLAMLIDEVGGTMSAMTGIWATAMGLAFPYIPQFGELAEKAAVWNVELENRYKKTEAMREANAQRYLDLEYSMTDAAKEEADKRQKIAEEELLIKQKLAAEAEARKPDLSIWGLLTPEQMEDFAVEMALLHEKQAEEGKKIQMEKWKEFSDWAKEQNKFLQENRRRAEENERQLKKKTFSELIKDTRKYTKQELHDYIEYLNKKKLLFAANSAEREEIEKEISEKIHDIWDLDITKLKEIGNTFQELAQFVSEVDEKLGKTINSVGKLIREFSRFKEAKTPWGELGATIGIFSTIISVFKDLTKVTEDLNTNWEWFVKHTIAFGIEKKEIQDAIKYMDILYGDKRISQMSKVIELIEEEIKRLKELAEASDRAVPIVQLEPLKEALRLYQEEYNRILTGTTASSIADAISDGFVEGLDSAQVFANTFEDIMKNALIGVFERAFITKYLDTWYVDFVKAMESGGELTSAEIWALGEDFRKYIEEGRTLWQTLLGTAGLPGLFDEEALQPPGLTGAIKGITEETAGLLAGQFNAIRMNTVEMLSIADNILLVNNRIADNTEYNVHLESIDDKLSALEEVSFERVIGG